MKILTVFTGGTIGSLKKGGVISPDKGNPYRLLDMYSRIDGKTEFAVACPFNILSENLCEQNLTALYDCIVQAITPDIDGVIVTHGTDTLQYTGAFLSYSLGLDSLPVVLVSANYPLEDSRSNGMSNFCAAVDFIKSGGGRGVFAAYTNLPGSSKIHRASRVLPHLPYSDCIFSVFDRPFGFMKERKFVKNSEYSEAPDQIKRICVCDSFYGDKVSFITAVPSGDYGEPAPDLKAVLIQAFHSGTLNTGSQKLIAFCRRARALDVPVYLTGACSGFNYESKELFENLGINVLPAASPAAMYIKLKMLDRRDYDKLGLSVGGDLVEQENGEVQISRKAQP